MLFSAQKKKNTVMYLQNEHSLSDRGMLSVEFTLTTPIVDPIKCGGI